MDGHLVAGIDLLADPVGEVLRRRVETLQHIVEDGVVQPILDQLLDAGEIDDHAILVQRLGLAINRDDPIMPMKVLALAGIRQVQAMGG